MGQARLALGAGMTLVIDTLTEAGLTDPNDQIVERRRRVSQMRANVRILEFKVGDRVSFQPEGHR
jgi:hypothetical protein